MYEMVLLTILLHTATTNLQTLESTIKNGVAHRKQSYTSFEDKRQRSSQFIHHGQWSIKSMYIGNKLRPFTHDERGKAGYKSKTLQKIDKPAINYGHGKNGSYKNKGRGGEIKANDEAHNFGDGEDSNGNKGKIYNITGTFVSDLVDNYKEALRNDSYFEFHHEGESENVYGDDEEDRSGSKETNSVQRVAVDKKRTRRNAFHRRFKHDSLAEFPENGTLFNSCKNRCGEHRGLNVTCSCHISCFVYKICCEDITTDCPFLEFDARQRIGTTLVDSYLYTHCHKELKVFMVDRCPEHLDELGNVNDGGDFLSDLNLRLPVFDNDTGVLYQNRHIYTCHNTPSSNANGNIWDTSSLIQWLVRFDFDAHQSRPFFTSVVLRNLDPDLVVYYPPSDEVKGQECERDLIDTCKTEFEFRDPDNKCGKFIQPVSPPDTLYPMYANIYCYRCVTNRTDAFLIRQPPNNENTAFLSLLFQYNADDSFTVSKQLTTGNNVDWESINCNEIDDLQQKEHSQQVIDKIVTPPFLFSKKSLNCRIDKCAAPSVLRKGICVTKFDHMFIVRNPPYDRLDTSKGNTITKLITCYMENKYYPIVSMYKEMKACEVENIEILPTSYSGSKEGTLELKPNETIKWDLYSFIQIQGYTHIRKNRQSLLLEAAFDAVIFWYISNAYAVSWNNDFVIFSEFYEQFTNLNESSLGENRSVFFDEKHPSLNPINLRQGPSLDRFFTPTENEFIKKYFDFFVSGYGASKYYFDGDLFVYPFPAVSINRPQYTVLHKCNQDVTSAAQQTSLWPVSQHRTWWQLYAVIYLLSKLTAFVNDS